MYDVQIRHLAELLVLVRPIVKMNWKFSLPSKQNEQLGVRFELGLFKGLVTTKWFEIFGALFKDSGQKAIV